MKITISFKRNKRIIGLELMIMLTIGSLFFFGMVGISSSSTDDFVTANGDDLVTVSSNYTNITVSSNGDSFSNNDDVTVSTTANDDGDDDVSHQSPPHDFVYNRIGNTYRLWEERKNELMKAKGMKEERDEERKAHLEQLHAESQRLLRETRAVSFKAVPLVQKLISSILERIRKRKLEVSKRFSQTYDLVKEDDGCLKEDVIDNPKDGQLSESVEKLKVSSVSNGDSESNETDVLGEKKSYDNGSSQMALDEDSTPVFRAPVDDTKVKKRIEYRFSLWEERTQLMKANETKGMIRVKQLLLGEFLSTAIYSNYVMIFTCFFAFLTWATSPPTDVFLKHAFWAFLLWFLNFAIGYCVKQQDDEKAIAAGWYQVLETIFRITLFGSPLIMVHYLFITLWSWEGLRGGAWSIVEAIGRGISNVAQSIRGEMEAPFPHR